MAPNLDVKSESWIDLSGRALESHPEYLSRVSLRHTVIESAEANKLRGRPASAQVSLERQNQTRGKSQLNQHLLIRLRQQSYLNRSSNSLASSLSNSVDLNASIAGGLSLDLSECGGAQVRAERPLLKAEPRRLSFIRNKLQRRRARERTQTSSPLTRSWSSLSERLAGKLNDFRHSWKHLLHSYSQMELNGELAQQAEQSEPSVPTELDKQRLTDEWIRRHQQNLLRPRSLDIPATGARWLPDNEPFGQHWTRADLQYATRASSQQPSRLHGCRYSADKPKPSVKRHSSPAARDSSSSTTLVSQQQQVTSLSPSVSLDSIASSTSTFYSSKMQTSRSSANLEQPAVQQQTSDYWSTVASSDYYKQHLQQQQQIAEPVPVNATHLPLLANDQEYYLDVASASALETQQQQHLLRLEPNMEALAHCDEDYDDYAVPSDESYRLERSQVELVQMIGEGQKGFVFLGKLQSRDGSQIVDVAIKTLKYETEQLIEKLMREAAMMRQFEHPHIIKFIGVCPETPALIAMELAQFGEVKQYLENNRHVISVSQLVLFTFQISTALSYLESKQYVHRDVAARNVLVCSHNCVKLADFGLSRNLQLADPEGSSHYTAASRGKLPVRWLAPESLAFRRFTSASDVWMFAVCSWELFQLGQLRPWAHIRNNQVLAAIEMGQRLSRPPTCPLRLYQLMLQCWSYAPGQRPKFRELKQSLWSIYLNERAQEQLELEQQQRALAKQQQDRLLLLMNNRLQQVAGNSSPGGSPQGGQQQRPSPIPQPTGYSSTAATATTDNSSRSSSMGSLARGRARAAAAAKAGSAWQVYQLPARPTPVSPSPSPEAPARNRQQLEQQQALDRNMRRFQRGRGQALQKQRSQGSIVSAAPLGPARGPLPFDDHALLGRHARQQQALLRSGSPRVRPADGAEADEDSSGPELGKGPAAVRAALPSVRLVEPAYEGLQDGVGGREIAMVRGERSPTGARANVMMVRPLSWRQPTVPLESPADAKLGQKLEQALQSMSVAPMKARLARQQSVDAASVRRGPAVGKPAEVPPSVDSQAEEQRQLALHQRILGHIRRSTATRSPRKPAPQPTTSAPNKAETVDQSLQILESLIGRPNGEQLSGGSRGSRPGSRQANRPRKPPSNYLDDGR